MFCVRRETVLGKRVGSWNHITDLCFSPSPLPRPLRTRLRLAFFSPSPPPPARPLRTHRVYGLLLAPPPQLALCAHAYSWLSFSPSPPPPACPLRTRVWPSARHHRLFFLAVTTTSSSPSAHPSCVRPSSRPPPPSSPSAHARMAFCSTPPPPARPLRTRTAFFSPPPPSWPSAHPSCVRPSARHRLLLALCAHIVHTAFCLPPPPPACSRSPRHPPRCPLRTCVRLSLLATTTSWSPSARFERVYMVLFSSAPRSNTINQSLSALHTVHIKTQSGAPAHVSPDTPFSLILHPANFSRHDGKPKSDPTAWNVTVDDHSKERHVPSANSPAEAALMSDGAHKIVSNNRRWNHLLQPAPAAPLYCRQRGKYLVIGNKYNVAIVHLRLEGCIVGVTREVHDEIVGTSIAVQTFNKSRMTWETRRSYRLPPRFVEPGSSPLQNRTVTVLVSFVSKDWAWMIVDHLRFARVHIYTPPADVPLTADSFKPGSTDWDSNIFNPTIFANVAWDWIEEPADAEKAFREFFASDYAQSSDRTILHVFLKPRKQDQFASGIGRHLIMDILFLAAIFPGTPLFMVTPEMQERLLVAIKKYMSSLQGEEYLRDVCKVPGSQQSNPFRFNDNANAAYFRGWVHWHHCTKAMLDWDLFCLYARLGCLDYNHVLGQPYDPQLAEAFLRKYTQRQRISTKEQFVWRPVMFRSDREPGVRSVNAPHNSGFWTVMVCKIPSSFRGHVITLVTSDLAKFAFTTTIGPEQFRVWVLNRINYRELSKSLKNCPPKAVKHTRSEGGRRRKERTTHNTITRSSADHVRKPYVMDKEMKKYVLPGAYSTFFENTYEAQEQEKINAAKAAAKAAKGGCVDSDQEWFEIIPKGRVRGTQSHLDMSRVNILKEHLRRAEARKLEIEKETARKRAQEERRKAADEAAGITRLPNGVILHAHKIRFVT
ncbi:hypothetical protein HGRIS_008955 [Hohenbuehelia grisea]|uniref:Uncharacterized protein n=1 Tax=Hohenbuehelia grisea TaxID=104357 RepID=A0ABR3IZL4_9AGAR